MSLLMEALKQAEHAKHSAQSETPPPALTPAAQLSVDDAPANLAELSLSPVDQPLDPKPTATDTLVVDNFLPQATAPSLEFAAAEIDLSPSAAPDATAAELRNESEPESQPEPSVPVASTPAATEVDHHHSPQAAARILAASAAQQAVQRRRNIVGLISLAGIVSVAIGCYYYYAALAQTTPYLGLPQPAVTATTDLLEATSVDTAIVATEPVSPPADTAPQDETVPAVPTPWQDGPAPESIVTQDWEPAPVDPRILRGEQPLAEFAAADATAEPATPAASIRITRGTQLNQVSQDLQAAYTDFQTGRLAQAEQGYRKVLARDANNRDARMGLAAIAVRNGQLDSARALYRAILQRDPKDLSAQAALTDLGQDRPADSESQLKTLLAEQPDSAQLQFALANLYAEQQRWPYAQQAYFEAQRLAPEHPDYAFNLAVSLEHLGQPRLALDYYQRAIQLAGPHNAQFDLNTARQRVAVLSAQAQP